MLHTVLRLEHFVGATESARARMSLTVRFSLEVDSPSTSGTLVAARPGIPDLPTLTYGESG